MFAKPIEPWAGRMGRILPAHGTNQIAGFVEYRPLTNWEKNNVSYCNLTNVSIEYLFCHCYFSHHAKSASPWCDPGEETRRPFFFGKLKMSAKRAKMAVSLPIVPNQTSEWWSGFHSRETKYFICNVKWEEFLPSWVRLSFNAWEAKNLIGGQKYVVVMTILKHVT